MMYYYLYMGTFKTLDEFQVSISGGLFPEMAFNCEAFLREEFGLEDWKIK